MHLLKNLVNKGIFGNRWFWFHSMGGAVGAKLFAYLVDPWQAFGLVVVIAFLWEVFELWGDDWHPENVYGSVERWVYDSVMDIVGAVFMAFVVVV